MLHSLHSRVATGFTLLACTCTFAFAAETVEDEEIQSSFLGRLIERSTYDLQLGVDAWDLHPSVEKDTTANMNGNKRLFLANSSTEWPYQDAAPWLRFQGRARLGSDTTLSLQYRADQALGSQVDGLSLDQAYHSLGARIGVLDYKTSWCRTYDIDAPWVRENDPFCATNANRPTSAAPGVQFYANHVAGNLKWQAVVGGYSPLILNYDAIEFTNTLINSLSSVTKNDKVGASLNVINLETGTELRFAFLHTDQNASYRRSLAQPTYLIQQEVDVAYAGASMNFGPTLNLRFTQLRSTMRGANLFPAGYARPDDTIPAVYYRETQPKVSSVLEANYYPSAQDTLSFAYSSYDLYSDTTFYRIDLRTLRETEDYHPRELSFATTNVSLSWRRDWQKGIFTVLQWTYAEVHSALLPVTNAPPVETSSHGNALGVRLGYRF